MSPVGERSRVALLLADYAAADAVNKINALGIGWSISGFDAATGLTAPQTVVALIDSPPDLYGEPFVLTLTLRDESDQPVSVPGPTGGAEAMRVTQNARVEEPLFPPGANVPRGVAWSHTQVTLNIANGLPLPVGRMFTWTLEIDSDRDPRWAVSFYVPGPPQGPVLGGPANPASIPELGNDR